LNLFYEEVKSLKKFRAIGFLWNSLERMRIENRRCVTIGGFLKEEYVSEKPN
jgi:hypothetical protein